MTNQIKAPPPNKDDGSPKAFLSCDYDERKPGTYRGITIEYGDVSSRHFSGAPYLDRYDARKEARDAGYKILTSSSWDNFITDAVSHFVDQLDALYDYGIIYLRKDTGRQLSRKVFHPLPQPKPP